jgi:hypothetical protein
MSTVEKRNRVRELTDVPFPSSDAPDPLVLADEETLVVSYIPATPSTEQSRVPSPDEAAIIVAFRRCYAIHFGLPNDEAFATHPLAERGLRPCGAFEVENSSWVRGLDMRNRGHPHHDPVLFQQLRHWVLTFHNSVLECAALSYAAMESRDRSDVRVSRMHELLRSP